MTLIVYHKGKLYSDQAGLIIEGKTYTPKHLKKSFVSKDKKIGIVYTGDEIDFQSEAFKKQLRRFRQTIPCISREGLSKTIFTETPFGECDFILMTNKNVFTVCRKKEDPLNVHKISCQSLNDFLVNGSGSSIAEAFYTLGYDIKQIFYKVFAHAAGSFVTDIDEINIEDLKPF